MMMTAAEKRAHLRWRRKPSSKAILSAIQYRYTRSPKGRAVQARWRAKQRTKRRSMIDALKTFPACCLVCGLSGPPEVMQFHHRPEETKRFTIASGFSNHSWSDVLAEIAKCDLVCANHHASITVGRIPAKRLAPVDISDVKTV
jgi:hypothetical protein